VTPELREIIARVEQRIRNLGRPALNLHEDWNGLTIPRPRLCDICASEEAAYGINGMWYCLACWLGRIAPRTLDEDS